MLVVVGSDAREKFLSRAFFLFDVENGLAVGWVSETWW